MIVNRVHALLLTLPSHSHTLAIFPTSLPPFSLQTREAWRGEWLAFAGNRTQAPWPQSPSVATHYETATSLHFFFFILLSTCLENKITHHQVEVSGYRPWILANGLRPRKWPPSMGSGAWFRILRPFSRFVAFSFYFFLFLTILLIPRTYPICTNHANVPCFSHQNSIYTFEEKQKKWSLLIFRYTISIFGVKTDFTIFLSDLDISFSCVWWCVCVCV